jgi:hypothetical protein
MMDTTRVRSRLVALISILPLGLLMGSYSMLAPLLRA